MYLLCWRVTIMVVRVCSVYKRKNHFQGFSCGPAGGHGSTVVVSYEVWRIFDTVKGHMLRGSCDLFTVRKASLFFVFEEDAKSIFLFFGSRTCHGASHRIIIYNMISSESTIDDRRKHLLRNTFARIDPGDVTQTQYNKRNRVKNTTYILYI